MALPGLVLVHGAAHAADCWRLTAEHIHRLEPSIEVLAVDLPGRRGRAGDFANTKISNWVDAVVADIDHRGLTEVVLVGHSLAGLTIPGVMAALGSSRVRESVFAAAAIPPEGMSVADSLLGVLGLLARRRLRQDVGELSRLVARFTLTNGMPWAERTAAMELLVPEAVQVVNERVSRSTMPMDISRTWISTSRDRLLPLRQQRRCIANLGGVETVISVDTCHMVMLSEPEWLAAVLVDRCRLRS